jgi:hypothetical protein
MKSTNNYSMLEFAACSHWQTMTIFQIQQACYHRFSQKINVTFHHVHGLDNERFNRPAKVHRVERSKISVASNCCRRCRSAHCSLKVHCTETIYALICLSCRSDIWFSLCRRSDFTPLVEWFQSGNHCNIEWTLTQFGVATFLLYTDRWSQIF